MRDGTRAVPSVPGVLRNGRAPETSRQLFVQRVFGHFDQRGSLADKAGMQPGDVILEATGADMKVVPNPTTEQMTKIAGSKGTLLLRVGRKDARFYITMTK